MGIWSWITIYGLSYHSRGSESTSSNACGGSDYLPFYSKIEALPLRLYLLTKHNSYILCSTFLYLFSNPTYYVLLTDALWRTWSISGNSWYHKRIGINHPQGGDGNSEWQDLGALCSWGSTYHIKCFRLQILCVIYASDRTNVMLLARVAQYGSL